jgi:hypothetical protein
VEHRPFSFAQLLEPRWQLRRLIWSSAWIAVRAGHSRRPALACPVRNAPRQIAVCLTHPARIIAALALRRHLDRFVAKSAPGTASAAWLDTSAGKRHTGPWRRPGRVDGPATQVGCRLNRRLRWQTKAVPSSIESWAPRSCGRPPAIPSALLGSMFVTDTISANRIRCWPRACAGGHGLY